MSAPTDSDFASALRAAVSARGLSLERVRGLLAQHGVSVSIATLSYWQTGRSRPERSASLAALGALETVLGVPRGSLASRVDFRRGHEAEANGYPAADVHATSDGRDGGWQRLGTAFAHLGLSPDDGLANLSFHDRIRVRADGMQGSHEVRTVLRALRDGVDRFPIWFDQAERGARPMIVPELNCRLGEVVDFPGNAATAAALLLDQPLRQGDTTMVQYRFENVSFSNTGASSAGTPGLLQRSSADPDSFARSVLGRVRELAIEVAFDADRLPVSVEQVCVVAGVETVRPLQVADPLLFVDLDAESGTHGLRWTW